MYALVLLHAEDAWLHVLTLGAPLVVVALALRNRLHGKRS